ncbi:MAG: hypothetical protein NTZ43_08050 [Gemmatimonadetes bacterium]|nr:hypothetical protein [Gemmatimonadota bacterium]
MAVLTHTHDIAAAAARTQKKAAAAFRNGRDATADVLETAADRINAGADRVTTVAHDTADTLENTSALLRGNRKRTVARNVRALIKEHAGLAVIGAIVLGFVSGRVFRRD